jgi:hypothetical protein
LGKYRIKIYDKKYCNGMAARGIIEEESMSISSGDYYMR